MQWANDRGGFILRGLGLCGVVVAIFLLPLLRASSEALEPNVRTDGWHKSRVVGSPEPPPPYSVHVAFPSLSFDAPVEMLHEVETDTFVVGQQDGKVLAFPNDREASHSTLLLDIETHEPGLENLWGIALHPRLVENPYLFACYSVGERTVRLSRFRIDLTGATFESPEEKLLLEFTTYGHAGGSLTFGPDGYLYVAIGDGSGANDALETGQDLSDLYASILRLDVDSQGDEPYAIPPDNPFLDHPNARPEIWAYGVRQVWKMSFDPVTEKLWCGDVGQDLWEALYQLEVGGNYGWSIHESGHPFRTDRKRGPSPILPPVASHAHYEMRSITAGHAYHGERLSELRSTFIYGGYDSGTIWAVDSHVDTTAAPPEPRLLADTQLRISCFGRDFRSGEVFPVDHASGRIYEFIPNTDKYDPKQFPRRLSETRLFKSVRDQIPEDGVVPLEVNSPLWSDGAVKKRFLALPGTDQIDFEKVTYLALDQPGWRGWQFPNGTVLVKTFYLNVDSDDGARLRPIETRLLQLEVLDSVEGHWYEGNNVWKSYSYRWNEENTDAELVSREGLDVAYQTIDEDGNSESLKWRFPARSECSSCHTQAASYTLSANTAQINRSVRTEGGEANQLRLLNDIGAFRSPISPESQAVALPDPKDESLPLEQRAKSYLHANCSHCHRPFGGGNSPMDLRFHTPVEKMNVVGVTAKQGAMGLRNPTIVEPARPDVSVLYRRMMSLDGMRMPKTGSHKIDEFGTALIYQWIESL